MIERDKFVPFILGSPDPNVTGLVHRFLTDEQRASTLGPNPDVNAILTLTGDLERGAAVYGRLQCNACHVLEKKGIAVGPSLDQLGVRLKREQILESLLEPSKQIAPEYVTQTVVTAGGQVVVGMVINQSETSVTLKTSKNEVVEINRDEVDAQEPSMTSLMPEGLLSTLKPQEAADLIEYLKSLN